MTQNDNTVAYPGREGAHSAAACDRLFPAARLVAQPTFQGVVEAVISRRCAYGVLPIESSLVGPVNETHDLLYDSPLSIVAEAILPIRHCLVGPAAVALEDVREIRSHAVALDQCRKLLASMPWATAVVAADDRATRRRGRRARGRDGDRDRERAGRAAALARRALRRRRRPRRVHALRGARAVHAARPAPRRVAHRAHVRDAPPAGRAPPAIEPLARRGIDMVQLVSRPIPSRPFDYRFDCVLGGHPLDAELAAALAEMKPETARLRVFGSYRADRDEGWETVAA